MKKIGTVRSYLLVAVTILSFGYLTTAAEASLMEFQYTGTGIFGVFNGTEFNNGSLSVSIVGDTALVDTTDPANPFIDGLSGTITFTATEVGTNTGTFSNPLYVFNYQGADIVGFGNTDPDPLIGVIDLLNIYAPSQGLSSYDLTLPFGPITGSLIFPSDMTLSIGVLGIEDAASLTFQAVPVPVPPSMLLLGSGLLGLAIIRRKFKK